MAKVCKGGTLVKEGQTSWPIPYRVDGYGETQCTESGGVIVNEGGGCGAAAAAQSQSAGSDPGLAALASGAFASALKLRESMAGSELVRDFDIINEAPEIPEIIAADKSISERLGQVIGMISACTVDLLLGTDSLAVALPYSADLHEWVAGLAKDIRSPVKDDKVRAAIDRVVTCMKAHTGRRIGDVYRSLRDKKSPPRS